MNIKRYVFSLVAMAGWLLIQMATPVQAADIASGEKVWSQVGTSDPNRGDNRTCATCHGKDLTKPGRHARTGKQIDPMALSVAKGRYSDVAKVEKWFRRNCKWTFGRECTISEKADLLAYLKSI